MYAFYKETLQSGNEMETCSNHKMYEEDVMGCSIVGLGSSDKRRVGRARGYCATADQRRVTSLLSPVQLSSFSSSVG